MPVPARRRLPCLLLATLGVAVLTSGPATATPSKTRKAANGHRSAAKPARTTAVKQRPYSRSRAQGQNGWAAPATLKRPAASTAPAPVPATTPANPVAALLTPVIAALTPTTAAPAIAGPETGTTTTTPPATTTPAPAILGIQETESPSYRMLLSRTTVAAGPVRIQLKNTGADAHNVLIVRTDGTGDATAIPLTAPGGTTDQSVTLDAGSYRLYCTLTTPVVHETAGMRGTITVTP